MIIHDLHGVRVECFQVLRFEPELVLVILFILDQFHFGEQDAVKPVDFDSAISTGHVELVLRVDEVRLEWLLYSDLGLHFL